MRTTREGEAMIEGMDAMSEAMSAIMSAIMSERMIAIMTADPILGDDRALA
jgi:hypothetical protein